MLKQIYNLAAEPFRPGDKHRPLRWRVGMRLNHLNHELRAKWPRIYNAYIQTVRFAVCRIFGHRWTSWEHVKYGDFGVSRTCRACQMHHGEHRGENTFHETHRRGGWVKLNK